MDAWFRPALTQSEIRRDLRRYASSAPPKITLREWAERQRLRGSGPRRMGARGPHHAEGARLAELFPNGRLVEIPGSYTLIPEDQPLELARAIRSFVRDTP